MKDKYNEKRELKKLLIFLYDWFKGEPVNEEDINNKIKDEIATHKLKVTKEQVNDYFKDRRLKGDAIKLSDYKTFWQVNGNQVDDITNPMMIKYVGKIQSIN